MTALSRTTGIPVSTLFEKIKAYEPKFVPKTVSLLNFEALGFATHANILLKSGKDPDALQLHLMKHPSVNSLYRVHDAFDFLAEGVFRTMRELNNFVQDLKKTYGVRSVEVQYLMDDLRREGFLSDPALVDELISEPVPMV